MRKGSPSGGVRDYHWSALTYVMARMEKGMAGDDTAAGQ